MARAPMKPTIGVSFAVVSWLNRVRCHWFANGKWSDSVWLRDIRFPQSRRWQHGALVCHLKQGEADPFSLSEADPIGFGYVYLIETLSGWWRPQLSLELAERRIALAALR